MRDSSKSAVGGVAGEAARRPRGRRRIPGRATQVDTSSFWLPVLHLLLAAMMLTVLAAVAVGDVETGAAALSFLPAMLVAGFLGATREREIFHPLTFVFLTVFFGITVQTFYLLYLDQGDHRFAIGKMTDANTVTTAILAVSIGVAALLAGFATAGNRGLARTERRKSARWKEGRVRFVTVVCLAVGLVSLVYYASVFDILENIRDQFAVKRRLVDENTGVARTLTWVRFGVNFSQLAFFLAYAAYLRDGSRSGYLKAMTIVAGIAGIVMPFVASSRLGMLTFLLGAAMIHHFSTGGWPLRRLRTVGILVLVLLVAMGSLRYMQSRSLSYAEYQDTVSLERIAEPVLGSSNFLAVGKTAVVLESVPTLIDYQYGTTYLLWMVAPIPRSIWPDKPIIRIGAVLGEAIFGTSLRGGVPPGIVGELFLNFGWAGIPAGMFLYGLFLARFYRRYGMSAHHDVNSRVIYSSIVVFVAFTGLSADFSGMMGMTLQRLVPLALLLWFVSTAGSASVRDERGVAYRAKQPTRRPRAARAGARA